MNWLQKVSIGSFSLAVATSPCARADAQTRAPLVRSAATEPAAKASLQDVNARAAVRSELDADRHLIASSIDVTVMGGIVQLSGAVPVLPWRLRASRVAAVVRGVRAVVNRIRVVPERREDRVVRHDVRRALRATAALASMPIHVTVKDGVVLLTGAISSWEEQQLAERVASGVPGARFCQNQLTWSRTARRTPAIIAADVETRLDWDPLVGRERIRVSVRAHRVVLGGTIGSRAQRKRAIALAWVKGVTAVDATALSIHAATHTNPNLRDAAPTDQEISTTIRDLASYWPSLAAAVVRTTVVSGVVFVHGTVQTLAEKDAVEAMARSAVGVVEVHNELRGPWWSPPAPPRPRLPVRPQPEPKRKSR